MILFHAVQLGFMSVWLYSRFLYCRSYVRLPAYSSVRLLFCFAVFPSNRFLTAHPTFSLAAGPLFRSSILLWLYAHPLVRPTLLLPLCPASVYLPPGSSVALSFCLFDIRPSVRLPAHSSDFSFAPLPVHQVVDLCVRSPLPSVHQFKDFKC